MSFKGFPVYPIHSFMLLDYFIPSFSSNFQDLLLHLHVHSITFFLNSMGEKDKAIRRELSQTFNTSLPRPCIFVHIVLSFMLLQRMVPRMSSTWPWRTVLFIFGFSWQIFCSRFFHLCSWERLASDFPFSSLPCPVLASVLSPASWNKMRITSPFPSLQKICLSNWNYLFLEYVAELAGKTVWCFLCQKNCNCWLVF